MFESEAYRSYVQLCRELRLERELQEGDWYRRGRLIMCFRSAKADGWLPGHKPLAGDPTTIWLPRLDQGLAMLEEAGVWAVILERKHGVAFCVDATLGSGHPAAQAPTREEATLRLCMAVRSSHSSYIGWRQ